MVRVNIVNYTVSECLAQTNERDGGLLSFFFVRVFFCNSLCVCVRVYDRSGGTALHWLVVVVDL